MKRPRHLLGSVDRAASRANQKAARHCRGQACQESRVPFEDQDGWMAHSIGQNPYHPPVNIRTEYGPTDLDAANYVMGEWFF